VLAAGVLLTIVYNHDLVLIATVAISTTFTEFINLKAACRTWDQGVVDMFTIVNIGP
jgi:energy-converting hydrogenase Eha subunit E